MSPIVTLPPMIAEGISPDRIFEVHPGGIKQRYTAYLGTVRAEGSTPAEAIANLETALMAAEKGQS